MQFSPQIAQANDVVTIDVSTVDQPNDGFTISSDTITLTGGYDYIIKGATTTYTILVDQDVSTNITLNNAEIDVSETSDAPALYIYDGAVNLTLVGENSLKSGIRMAGLTVPTSAAVTIDGTGSLEVTGGDWAAGIGGGDAAPAGTIIINGGTINASGGEGGAGIGSSPNAVGGAITINDGTITATGGVSGAGIGGGDLGDGGNITINGGAVTAIGGADSGYDGAGIGGGDAGEGGNITINGGAVIATGGGDSGAGIGGGTGNSGGTITINGGTITATSGTIGGAGIGGGDGQSANGTVTIDGGSVWMSNFDGPQPKSSVETSLYLHTLTVGDPGIASIKMGEGTRGQVRFINGKPLENEYGIHDVSTDESGKIYLWLPVFSSETILLTARGSEYTAYYAGVANNNNEATLEGGNEPAIKVTGVNSGDTSYIYWDMNTLNILQDGAYTLSLREDLAYTSWAKVWIASGVTADITLDGVKIDVSSLYNACAFSIVDAEVNLNLVGANMLKSSIYRAGINVSEASKLTIDGTGSLEAIGSESTAGIGGNIGKNGGEIIINGGTISATGGESGAGIGGGVNGSSGSITINGGAVTAVGGDYGAGIGGGEYAGGDEITINGGTITATGSMGGAGIGGGSGDDGYGGTINISGGTITAIGNAYAAAIGGGYGHLKTGTVTIDGGSVKVNNFSGPQPKNSELASVYLNTLTLDDPSAANARVTKLTTAAVVGSASAGPASSIMAGEYGTNGVYTDESGILYAWLPDSAAAEEELTVKAGGKTYTSTYIRAADNNNSSTLAKIAGVDDVKVLLTPDSTSKNAGYDGHIDVSFDDAVGYEAYALAIPMLFDNDTIEITNLETVDFAAKNLTGLLVNGTFLSGARDYDSSSEVLSVINSEGKFLLSWTVEEDIPLVPHTLTGDVYFRIHYRVKENVPTSASFAIGEYNDTNGITSDQIFGIDGLGILSSNQDDFGAYLLVEGEYGILTQDYISVTVEDMPPVTISGDVNSISLQGRAMLTGKQRTSISAIGYTPNLNKIDAGIRVEMYEVDDLGDIVKQV
ncbi:MAG: hypothetical protein LBL34_02770, partial [Clostridiales bacterium]|nr:hypothetical protein [Clostridiales bacterium]